MITIHGLVNGHNPSLSTVDVTVLNDAVGAIVVMAERGDNEGMSITNGVEFFAPQIAQTLGLAWGRAVWLESYPPGGLATSRFDATFDEVVFTGPVVARPSYHHRRDLPFARLAHPGWRRLSPQRVQRIAACGMLLSRLIGYRGAFADDSGATTEAVILGYDGRCYHTSRGEFAGRLLQATYGAGGLPSTSPAGWG